uniref:Uncharacterized protein n=1 Tax=Arundo donax TaxID=35708 RepID=A0A0A9AP17_ARUDO
MHAPSRLMAYLKFMQTRTVKSK